MHGAKGGPARKTLISAVPRPRFWPLLAPPAGGQLPKILAPSPERAATGRPTSCRLHVVQTARYWAHDGERWGSAKASRNAVPATCGQDLTCPPRKQRALPQRSCLDVTGSGSPACPDVRAPRRAAPRRGEAVPFDARRARGWELLEPGVWGTCGRYVELRAPNLHEDKGDSGLVNCCILSTWHVGGGERRSSVQQCGSECDVGQEESRGVDRQGSESATAKRLHPLVFGFSGIDPTLQPLVRHRLVSKALHCSLWTPDGPTGSLCSQVQPRMALCGVWQPPHQSSLHLPAMWFEKVVSQCCFDLHFLDYWLSYNLQ
ncbi:unnamed protein product [Nyctereutes procyonoides]|uniref:(raccoon dog) hypothetical protein n=1 Tax=Nyctereutes procyonoides TaxID=34880 RepID=A0A811YFX3_NYCPR|nr:unnamed protein product [Nyctereutes procyonoides]